jgi:ubiquinone biosynthesis protein
VISAISHLLRLTRAGYVFAREGVFSMVDTRPLPVPAKAAVALGRLIERPNAKDGSSRLAAALGKLGPSLT